MVLPLATQVPGSPAADADPGPFSTVTSLPMTRASAPGGPCAGSGEARTANAAANTNRQMHRDTLPVRFGLVGRGLFRIWCQVSRSIQDPRSSPIIYPSE